MTWEERAKRFLEEYEAVCRKYGVYVGACGCCDSPWLVDVEDEEWKDDPTKEHLEHLREFAHLDELERQNKEE